MLPHAVFRLLLVPHVKAAGTILREANRVDRLPMGTAFKFKRF